MALCALNKDIYSGSEIVLCAVTRVTKELLGCATGRRIACHAVKTTAQAVERFVIKPRGDRQTQIQHQRSRTCCHIFSNLLVLWQLALSASSVVRFVRFFGFAF